MVVAGAGVILVVVVAIVAAVIILVFVMIRSIRHKKYTGTGSNSEPIPD